MLLAGARCWWKGKKSAHVAWKAGDGKYSPRPIWGLFTPISKGAGQGGPAWRVGGHGDSAGLGRANHRFTQVGLRALLTHSAGCAVLGHRGSERLQKDGCVENSQEV